MDKTKERNALLIPPSPYLLLLHSKHGKQDTVVNRNNIFHQKAKLTGDRKS